ncbi:MAG: hypothetical protein IJY08_05560 [Clostridia bacterium]|nr:hypothetical protein [Clostridia bacterium]
MNLFQRNTKKQDQCTADAVAMRGLISQLCRDGRLDEVVEEYISYCHATQSHSAEEAARTKVKVRSRFPNIAGFCRYLGTGLSDISGLASDFPAEHDRLIAIFEDEALNSEVSPTLLSAYLKKRMRYTTSEDGKTEGKEVRYCFEHDIFSDGE